MPRVYIKDVRSAAKKFDDETVQRTLVDRSWSLGETADAKVYLKMEHLQRTGSFKTRGASTDVGLRRAHGVRPRL